MHILANPASEALSTKFSRQASGCKLFFTRLFVFNASINIYHYTQPGKHANYVDSNHHFSL